MLGGSVAGTFMNEKNALQIAAVWGSVSLISDSIATLPIKQYRKLGKKKKEIPVAPVIASPYSEYTRREFIHSGTVSLLLRGNFFGKIISRDPLTLLPTQVMPIHPDAARVTRLNDGQLEYRYYGVPVPNKNVTVARGLMVPGGYVGLNPVEYMRNSFGQARAQDIYNNSFFSNDATPSGIISVEGDMNEEQTLNMARAWMMTHQGSAQAHMPGVLTGGAKWQQVTINPQDAQFLEQMQLSASTISGIIYRVPPHMLGMTDKDSSWGAGIEQQELGFVRNTLAIWLERWEDLMSSWLPDGEFVKFDLNHRLRGDAEQRSMYYQVMRTIGAMNSLMVMEAEGLEIPADPATRAVLSAFDQPLNSSPMKIPATTAVAGDKAT